MNIQTPFKDTQQPTFRTWHINMRNHVCHKQYDLLLKIKINKNIKYLFLTCQPTDSNGPQFKCDVIINLLIHHS